MKYPKHIYEPVRYKVASSIIDHEFKKIFSDFTQEEYKKITKQVYGWGTDPKEYTLKSPRDFWNGIEGIMTGFRIKGVVKYITAENVTWTEENVNPKNLYFTTDHFYVDNKKIPTLNKSAKEVMGWLEKNDLTDKALRKVKDSFEKGIPRADDPIYCKKQKSKIYANDGNGRLMLALLKDKNEIPAFVGNINGDNPKNYWVPTILIVRYSQLYSYKIISKENYAKILTNLFDKSECTLVEYKERVPESGKINI